MQTLAGKDDKGKDYYFAYIERLRKVIVWVEGQYKYLIEMKKELICNCPGARYHGHCRHVDFVTDEFNFSKIVKPRTFLNKCEEEYYTEFLLNLKGELWK